jgi:hypothetical protein
MVEEAGQKSAGQLDIRGTAPIHGRCPQPVAAPSKRPG